MSSPFIVHQGERIRPFYGLGDKAHGAGLILHLK